MRRDACNSCGRSARVDDLPVRVSAVPSTARDECPRAVLRMHATRARHRLHVCAVVVAIVRKAALRCMGVCMRNLLRICCAWLGLLLCFGFGA